MIYFNGDSHTDGYGVLPTQRYSHLVSTHFNINEVNDAYRGASNQRIIRTSREYLLTNKPKLVVIGWTSWEREEWYYNGRYHNVNSGGPDDLHPDLHKKYRDWVIDQNEDMLKSKSNHWHNEIWKFHTELENNGIKHLFFNCMYNFFEISNEFNWGDSYIGPYNNSSSYYWYLNSKGFVPDTWYHYGPDGHVCWAQLIIDYIKQYNLL